MKLIWILCLSMALFKLCSSKEEVDRMPIVEFVDIKMDEIIKQKANDADAFWLLAYSNTSCMDCVKMTLDLIDVYQKEVFTLITLSNQHDHSYLKANLPSKALYNPLEIKVPFPLEKVTLIFIENNQIKNIIIPNLADRNKTSNEIYEALEMYNRKDIF
jgi:hypothetical protein